MNTSAERSTARNILDFSQYNTGVTINESGADVQLPAEVGGESIASASRINANATQVVVRGFHDMFGGRGNDVLVGDQRDNILLGMEGDDTLVGLMGNDLLVADTLVLESSDAREVRNTGSVSSVNPAWAKLPSREWTWADQDIRNMALGDVVGTQVLVGGLANDVDNDVLMGSSGADQFYSGLGDDVTVGDFALLRFDTSYNLIHAESDPTMGEGATTRSPRWMATMSSRAGRALIRSRCLNRPWSIPMRPIRR